MANPKRLFLGATLLSIGAFLAGACTFTEGDPDGGGGEGGNGGSASGGNSSGGTSSLGGQGGQLPSLDCSEGETILGTPGGAPADSDACLSCLYDLCQEAYTTCYAEGPVSACSEADIAYTYVSGDQSEVIVNGEFPCVRACVQDLVESGSTADFAMVEECTGYCGAIDGCDRFDAARPAVNLGYCMFGIDSVGIDDPAANGVPFESGLDCLTECGI